MGRYFSLAKGGWVALVAVGLAGCGGSVGAPRTPEPASPAAAQASPPNAPPAAPGAAAEPSAAHTTDKAGRRASPAAESAAEAAAPSPSPQSAPPSETPYEATDSDRPTASGKDPHGAQLVQFAREKRSLEVELEAADCKTACRSLGSMERAARRICDLAVSAEHVADCRRVQRELADARDRVRASCGACGATSP